MMISRRYFDTLAIQAIGPLSMLGLSIAITQTRGSAAQGEFASARAWIDLVAAVGLLGLPQSVVLSVNRFNTSRRMLFTWAVRYCLCILPIIGAASWVAKSLGVAGATLTLGFVAVMWILMGIWRGLLLTKDDGLRFNLVSAIPTFSIVVFASGALLAALPLEANLEIIFTAAGATALLCNFLIAFHPVYNSAESCQLPNYRQLFVHGIDVFAQTVCSSLQVYFCYYFLGRIGSTSDVGYMSIAILVLNALIFPLQSLSPMLLNRWSKSTVGEALSAGRNYVYMSAALLLLIATLVAIVAAWFSPLLFKAGSIPPKIIWLLLLSVVPALFARTSALRLASLGLFRINSKIAGMQLFIFAFCFSGLAQSEQLHPIGAAVIAWLLADIVAAFVFSLKLQAVIRTYN